MSYAANRNIPAAKAIDDYQDSIADPSVRQPKDISGYVLVGWPLALLAVCMAYEGVARFLSWAF